MRIAAHITLTMLIFMNPGYSYASGQYTVKDGFLITTLGSYKKSAETRRLCGKLPKQLVLKMLQKNRAVYDPIFTELVGDAPAFFLSGILWLYDREADTRTSAEHYFNFDKSKLNIVFGKSIDSHELYDMPIVCGDEEAALARKIKEKKEKVKNEPFKELAGANYLNSIYAGDFKTQDLLGWKYLRNMRKRSQEDVAMGVIFSTVASKITGREMNLTLLEEITMYYLKRTSERETGCFDPGAIEKTFIYNYPALIYGDGYTIPASTLKSKYLINKNFVGLCDSLCERQGVFYMVARGLNNSMAKLELAELFRGVDQIINNYECRNPIVKQFEKNLVRFNEMERNLPSGVRRNTLRAVLDTPRL